MDPDGISGPLTNIEGVLPHGLGSFHVDRGIELAKRPLHLRVILRHRVPPADWRGSAISGASTQGEDELADLLRQEVPVLDDGSIQAQPFQPWIDQPGEGIVATRVALARGTGTETGSPSANFGNHRHSFSIWASAHLIRGSRMPMSSPNR